MSINNIYSKRQKKLRGEIPDVYSYDDLPQPLRIQIIQIINEFLEDWRIPAVNDFYEPVVKSLRHEYGVVKLAVYQSCRDEFEQFFIHSENIDSLLDVIETSFLYLDANMRDGPNISNDVDKAIEELNYRFKEHGIGYHFSSPEIIRIDSEWIHVEIVQPALRLLEQQHYTGAREEFLNAHEYYRKGNPKEALTNCLKAFESVMKAICDMRDWSYNDKSTAKALIKICFDNGLIPSFWDQHYSSLRSLLESGIPTGRNRLGGHGQGTNPVTVPNHLVAHMLHMTAAVIVFLVEAEQRLE